ncbi:MAG: M20 family peptidase [Anaerolineaceae bacterium]|jgi:carboxypeptidase PM20D1
MNPLTIILFALAALVLILIVIVIVRTLTFSYEYEEVEPLQMPEIDGESVAQRIGLAVQLKTYSAHEEEKIDPLPFEALRDLLRTLYPQLEERLTREVINRHALLYTWQGSKPELDAVCFMAHQDVVPADEGPDSGWTYPPFSGEIADGYVWGRGTLDCKGNLICVLEAANNLVKQGFQPERTIYLAFGHDEENSGANGAKKIVDTLQERGVKLAFLLDEGGTVTRGQIKGVEAPVALIGVSEKGYLTLRLKARVPGGHSSMPPKQTAIGALSLAIAALESNPFPQRLEVAQFMLSHMGKEVPFVMRMALANPWLFGGVVKRSLASVPSTNAITRTTIAPTVIQAGHTENVLPAEAEALVNFRIMAGDTIQDVYERVRAIVEDDVVKVEPSHGDSLIGPNSWNPTPVADVDSPLYEGLVELVMATFPGAVVAPFMMTGGTDARHYTPICQNAFRFTPFFLKPEDIASVHGVNERLSIGNAAKAVGFYQALMRRVSCLPDGHEYAQAGEVEEPEDVQDVEEMAVTRRQKAHRAKAARQPAAQSTAEPAGLPGDEGDPVPPAKWSEPLPDDDEPLVIRPMKREGEG